MSEGVHIGIEALQLDEFGIEEASGMDVDEEGVEDPVQEVSPVKDDSDVAKEVETICRSS